MQTVESSEKRIREVEEEVRVLRLQVQDPVKQVCVVGDSDTG